MTKTADATTEIVYLKIDELEPHPKNPHGVLKKDDPATLDLKAKIEATGQKVPCLVRPHGKGYQLVLGHRRTFVQELLGKTEVPCLVEDLTDEQADVLVVQENDSHEPPNPFLEAEVVAGLLARPGWTLDSVAAQLGRGKRWVALRSNLKNLSAKIRKLYESGKLVDWPITWVEEIARLAPEAQDELAADKKGYRGGITWIQSREDLDDLLADRFKLLGAAPWDLEDAELVPAAGPCTTCPKNSLRSPGLFDDDLDAKDVKKATCRDAACFKKKLDTHTIQKVDELKAKHAGAILVKGEGLFGRELPESIEKDAIDRWTVDDVKKTAPGAVPAIVLSDKGCTVKYVKPKREDGLGARARKAASKAKKEAGKADDPKAKRAASKELIGKRRRAFVVDQVREKVEKLASVPVEVVPGLAAAYAVSGVDDGIYQQASTKKRRSTYDEVTGSPERFAKEVWPRIRRHVADTLKRYRPQNLDQEHEAATWVAGLVGIDVKAIVDKAVEKIPDPKWWGEDSAEKKLEKIGLLSSKKTPAHFMAEAATPGVCRGCGCTHDKACPQGCSWVELPDENGVKKKVAGRFLARGLCSSCAGDQPRGKKTKKGAKVASSK